jgi:hypothetical protein
MTGSGHPRPGRQSHAPTRFLSNSVRSAIITRSVAMFRKRTRPASSITGLRKISAGSGLLTAPQQI